MTIAEWVTTAIAIGRRRPSAEKYAAEARHMRAFPVDEINIEMDTRLLGRVTAMLKGPPHHCTTGFERPLRGHRQDAPQAPLIVAFANRVTRLLVAGVGANHPPSD